MGVLTFTLRIHNLAMQKSSVDHQILALERKIRDLTSYVSVIGGGAVTLGALLSAPSSMMGRALAFMGASHRGATNYVNANFNGAYNMYMAQTQGQANPQTQAEMRKYIFWSLYSQYRDRMAQIEEKNLKDIEGKLKQKKDILETQSQELAQEIKSTKEARDKDIEQWAPKYV